MKRSARVLLEDIRDSVDLIGEYTASVSSQECRERRILQDAVLHRIMIIGEAVKGLPDDVRNAHPEVEWSAIAGMRDVLVHEYFRVDLDLAWEVVKSDLPELREQLTRVLEQDA